MGTESQFIAVTLFPEPLDALFFREEQELMITLLRARRCVRARRGVYVFIPRNRMITAKSYGIMVM